MVGVIEMLSITLIGCRKSGVFFLPLIFVARAVVYTHAALASGVVKAPFSLREKVLSGQGTPRSACS